MTSSENVENKQDKRSESDNVHYVQFCYETPELADMPAEYQAALQHVANGLASRAQDTIEALTRSGELGRVAYLPDDMPTINVAQSIPSNPHASPISPTQVNRTPSMGIQDDDC